MQKPNETMDSRASWPQNRIREPRDVGHVPLRARVLFQPPMTNGLVDRVVASLWPWTVRRYPGIRRLRAWLLGCGVVTGDAYRKRVPRSRALLMAGKIETKAAELLALASELRAYAAGGSPARSLDAVQRRPVVVPPPPE